MSEEGEGICAATELLDASDASSSVQCQKTLGHVAAGDATHEFVNLGGVSISWPDGAAAAIEDAGTP